MATEGAYASVISIFGQQRQRGEAMTITGDGTHLRTYTYVGDIVRANMLAAEKQHWWWSSDQHWSKHRIFINEIAKIFGGPTKKYIAERIEPTA